MRVLYYVMLFLLMALTGSVPSGLAAELVGFRSLSLEPGDLVWGFKIQLKEGRIIAVCNVPDGWKITAENYGEAAGYKDGGGEIQGSCDFGHDAISAGRLSQLNPLLLIDRSTIHQKHATLSGDVTVVGPSDNRKVPLEPQNFTRRKAERCPVWQEMNGRTTR